MKPWFKRKVYGWGWTPSTWEGWAIIFGFVAAIFLAYNYFENKFLEAVFALTFLLILVCYKTGESPRWQWGSK